MILIQQENTTRESLLIKKTINNQINRVTMISGGGGASVTELTGGRGGASVTELTKLVSGGGGSVTELSWFVTGGGVAVMLEML